MKQDKNSRKFRSPTIKAPADELVGSIHRVRIEKIVPQGLGMLRIEGQVVFVPGALPGELVEISLGPSRGGYRNADLLGIIEASDPRVAPACSLFGTCGGCDAQYVQPDYQLILKKSLLQDTLRRQGGLDTEAEGLTITTFQGNPWEYRNRWQYHPVAAAENAGPALGLLRRNSKEAIGLADCPVASPEIRQWLQTKPPFLAMQGAQDDLDENPRRGPLMPVFGAHGQIFSGAGSIEIPWRGQTIKFSGKGFFQSNLEMLDNLINWLEKRLPRVETAWDLYCGCGVFSRLLETASSKVIGVDNQGDNCHFALANTEPTKTEIIQADVEAWLATYSGPNPDLIIVDPPRAGLAAKALSWLCANRPSHLVYVSCNPITFSRDLRPLRAEGYQVRDLALFDFYPQTWHIETACLLEAPR